MAPSPDDFAGETHETVAPLRLGGSVVGVEEHVRLGGVGRQSIGIEVQSEVSVSLTKLNLLASLVPARVIRYHLQRKDALAVSPYSESYDGGVLFADISGFSALAERLVRDLNCAANAAENLSAFVGKCLERMVQLVCSKGGDVIKFAGDALLAVFPSDNTQGSLETATLCCTYVALELLKLDLRANGTKLSVHCGIGAGRVTSFNVGGKFARYEYVITGSPVDQVGSAEPEAQAGEVVLARQAYDLIAKMCVGEQLDSGNFKVRSLVSPTDFPDLPLIFSEFPPLAQDPADLMRMQTILRSYVPRPALQAIDSGQSLWFSELRTCSTLFCKIKGLQFADGGDLEIVQSAMRAIQEQLYLFEGTLCRFIVDDKGAGLLMAFGLPPYMHENDPVRAVKTAMAIHEEVRKLTNKDGKSLSCAIGVTSGRVFCGTTGGSIRCEYTLHGTLVNLAARYMVAAKDGVLVGKLTWSESNQFIQYDPPVEIKVKGKEEKVSVYRPTSVKDSNAFDDEQLHPEGRQEELLGRKEEIKSLNDSLAAYMRNKRHTEVIMICGEAGIGKSRLMQYVCRQAREKLKLNAIIGSSADTESSTPFFVFRSVLMQLLHVYYRKVVKMRFRNWLQQRRQSDPEEWTREAGAAGPAPAVSGAALAPPGPGAATDVPRPSPRQGQGPQPQQPSPQPHAQSPQLQSPMPQSPMPQSPMPQQQVAPLHRHHQQQQQQHHSGPGERTGPGWRDHPPAPELAKAINRDPHAAEAYKSLRDAMTGSTVLTADLTEEFYSELDTLVDAKAKIRMDEGSETLLRYMGLRDVPIEKLIARDAYDPPDFGKLGTALRKTVLMDMIPNKGALRDMAPLLSGVLPKLIEAKDNDVTEKMKKEVRSENTLQLIMEILQNGVDELEIYFENELKTLKAQRRLTRALQGAGQPPSAHTGSSSPSSANTPLSPGAAGLGAPIGSASPGAVTGAGPGPGPGPSGGLAPHQGKPSLLMAGTPANRKGRAAASEARSQSSSADSHGGTLSQAGQRSTNGSMSGSGESGEDKDHSSPLFPQQHARLGERDPLCPESADGGDAAYLMRGGAAADGAASEQPTYRQRLVLMIEDLQWVDPMSRRLLEQIANTVSPLLLVISCRGKQPQGNEEPLMDANNIAFINLGNLSREEVRQGMCHWLGVQEIPDKALAAVMEKGGGHPLFSAELAKLMHEEGMIIINGGRCELSKKAQEGNFGLPNSISTLMTTKLDRLAPSQQLALKVAAVIGIEFQKNELVALMPRTDMEPEDADHSQLNEDIHALCEAGLLRREQQKLYHFRFTNAMLRESAYNLLLYQKRKDLHRKLAEFHEDRNKEYLEPVYFLLATNYFQAEVYDKAVTFAEMAGNDALHLHAMQQVLICFSRLLELDRKHPECTQHISLVRKVGWKRKLGEALMHMSKPGRKEMETDAMDCFQDALELIELWERPRKVKRGLLARLAPAWFTGFASAKESSNLVENMPAFKKLRKEQNCELMLEAANIFEHLGKIDNDRNSQAALSYRLNAIALAKEADFILTERDGVVEVDKDETGNHDELREAVSAELARSYAHAATFYMLRIDLPNYEEIANQQIKQALNLVDKVKDSETQALVHFKFSQFKAMSSDLIQAQGGARKALWVARFLNYEKILVEALELSVCIFTFVGGLGKANKMLEATVQAMSVSSPNYLILALHARIALFIGDFAAAEAALERIGRLEPGSFERDLEGSQKKLLRSEMPETLLALSLLLVRKYGNRDLATFAAIRGTELLQLVNFNDLPLVNFHTAAFLLTVFAECLAGTPLTVTRNKRGPRGQRLSFSQVVPLDRGIAAPSSKQILKNARKYLDKVMALMKLYKKVYRPCAPHVLYCEGLYKKILTGKGNVKTFLAAAEQANKAGTKYIRALSLYEAGPEHTKDAIMAFTDCMENKKVNFTAGPPPVDSPYELRQMLELGESTRAVRESQTVEQTTWLKSPASPSANTSHFEGVEPAQPVL